MLHTMKITLLIAALTLLTFSANAERERSRPAFHKADRHQTRQSTTHNVPDTGATAGLLLLGIGALAIAHKKITPVQ